MSLTCSSRQATYWSFAQELQGRMVRLVYLGPPSYIERAPGTYMLLGVRPFGAWLVESDLVAESHSRGTHAAD